MVADEATLLAWSAIIQNQNSPIGNRLQEIDARIHGLLAGRRYSAPVAENDVWLRLFLGAVLQDANGHPLSRQQAAMKAAFATVKPETLEDVRICVCNALIEADNG